MPGAVPSAPPSDGAATDATDRWRRRTCRPCRANGRCWGPASATSTVHSALSMLRLNRSARRPRRMATKTIKVDYIARVEGEGALDLEIRDGKVLSAELRIFEPPRLFEAMLRGRGHNEVPDIVARICGICPVAYQ